MLECDYALLHYDEFELNLHDDAESDLVHGHHYDDLIEMKNS